jgi:CelD/BcsL family acetyltransferase involved in cellulose biosynthesis
MARRVRLITQPGEFWRLAESWNDLLAHSGFNVVFLTHEWLSAWWRDYGAGHELFIIAVEDDAKLIALAPFMITREKKLQFIGHDISDYLDLIIAAEPAECFRLIFNEIKKRQGDWSFAEFIYLAQDSPFFLLWRKELDGLTALRKSLRRDCASVVLDLVKAGGNWAVLEKNLPSKRRNDLKRCPRLLGEQGSLSFQRLATLPEITAAFAHFAAHHKRRWQEDGQGSQFDNDRQIEHYLNIAGALAPRGWVELACLKLDDNYIAMAFGYVYGDRYYYYTPTFNPDYWKYSPGNILIKYLIESFYAEGRIKIFDLLRGEEKYKYTWSKDERQLYRARIYPQRLDSAILLIKHSLVQAVLPRLQRYPLLRKIKHSLLKLVGR